MKHRPDECPKCGFVWGPFQGQRYGSGYRKLAASVWKCARCGHTVETRRAQGRVVAQL